MSDYKRLTVKNWREGKHTKAYERLAELEDKLEDGRLWEAKYLEPRPHPFECAERWGELWYEANCQLNTLKNKIENGTLIELPCKVGDMVYRVVRDYDWKGSMFWRVDNWKFTYECLDHWGETVFLTKAEAEAKLRELKGE